MVKILEISTINIAVISEIAIIKINPQHMLTGKC